MRARMHLVLAFGATVCCHNARVYECTTPRPDPQALLGRVKLLEAARQLPAAADAAGEVAARWPWFVPGLIERARLLLAAGDWEGAAGAAGVLLKADAHNVTGLAITGAARARRRWARWHTGTSFLACAATTWRTAVR